MNRFWIALSLALGLVALPALAVAPEDNLRGQGSGPNAHNLHHPLGKKQFGLRQQALKDKATGKAAGRAYQVAKGQFVELEQTRNDRIFVILVEFGISINSVTGGTPGPLHNQIGQPDRNTDNTTIWQADYNKAHFEDMYFRRMKDYYRSQSSGRYSIDGTVTEWVKVSFNEARYGTNICGSIVCSSVWALVRDAINIWTADQLAAGKTQAEVKAYLDTFDVWDRYDHNGNGNFDEPDGYIDHMQIVHAGVGEETGGGAQGANAIWSHRWYAYFNSANGPGPAFNPLGGTQFGTTGIWVGDYTIQPENGGLGVFAHEYGHDLGLPDNYDTAGGENSTGFWDLMSSGSYLGDGTVDIGSVPGDLTAWDKYQLGWLNYETSRAGKISSHRMGPAETNTKAAQGLFTLLPDKVVTSLLAAPPEGSKAWYSGAGDNLDNSMTRSVAVPSSSPTLTMKLWYDIETDWDYAYVAVSADGGSTWTNLTGNLTTSTNPNGSNLGNGITGISGWVDANFNISAYAGQTVLLRLRYSTDGAVQGKGLLADAITLGSFFDGAEAGANGWTLNNFKASTGSESSTFFQAYLSEFRQYRGYDAGLKTGPYNFGFLNNPTLQNQVEHFPYQDGLLIHYWDTSQQDNNTSVHPGAGLILPIDAHPVPLIRADNVPWRARVQTYDATFGHQPTDAITLHRNSTASYHPSLPGVPVFNDLLTWWYPATPLAGVIAPKTGTVIEVVRSNTFDNFMQVNVKPAR